MGAKHVPEGYATVTPYLVVEDAARLIDFVKDAFSAEERFRLGGPGDTIGHAEVQIGDSVVMLSDTSEGYPPRPTQLLLYVEDCDAAFKRAVSAGAVEQVPLDNQFWGDRGGVVADPAGYTWWIATRKEDLTHDEIQHRAAEFFKQMAQMG